MKKYIFLLVGLASFIAYNTAEAKVFKLGRQSMTISEGAHPQMGGDIGGTATDKCPAGYCKSGGVCIKIANAPCQYGTTVGSDGSCVCSAMQCNDGYIYKGQCVPFCSGVSCKTGYSPTAKTDKCCCEQLSCLAGYSYNAPVKGCIKDTLDCRIGCNPIGCGVGSTLTANPGHYLTAEGTCPSCSSKINHCSRCSQSSLLSVTCTQCETGYTLQNGQCVLAGGGLCAPGYVYHPIIGQCVEAVCPSNCADMCNAGYCSSCNPGYYLNNQGKCVLSSGGIVIGTQCVSGYVYHPTIGQCVEAVCSINCADCSPGYCVSCKPGFSLNNQGKCTGTGDGSGVLIPIEIGQEGCPVGQEYNSILQTCVLVKP